MYVVSQAPPLRAQLRWLLLDDMDDSSSSLRASAMSRLSPLPFPMLLAPLAMRTKEAASFFSQPRLRHRNSPVLPQFRCGCFIVSRLLAPAPHPRSSVSLTFLTSTYSRMSGNMLLPGHTVQYQERLLLDMCDNYCLYLLMLDSLTHMCYSRYTVTWLLHTVRTHGACTRCVHTVQYTRCSTHTLHTFKSSILRILLCCR